MQSVKEIIKMQNVILKHKLQQENMLWKKTLVESKGF
jgi:hypothetical protein